MANKRIMTLDDLYKFFVDQNKNVSFSAKDKTPIVVSVPGVFAKEDDAMPGLLKLKLKVFFQEMALQAVITPKILVKICLVFAANWINS